MIYVMVVFNWVVFVVSANSAHPPELTACGKVTYIDAHTFVGGPLELK